MSVITIIDYGLGNLHSVSKSFHHLGHTVEIDHDGALIPRAERLVLPGVGAFADGIHGLRERGQHDPLRAAAAKGTPLLGICLGAQLLLDWSEEFGRHEGLGLVPGGVVRIRPAGVKVPHVGWARLKSQQAGASFPGILASLPPDPWFYFIHSYEMRPSLPELVTAVCRYGDLTLTAAVQNGNVSGVQFHPEKSGESGLTVLRTFALS